MLRYATPLLHLVALPPNLALLGRGASTGHLGAPGRAARRCGARPGRAAAPVRLARYYVLVTASIALGLWDRIRGRIPRAWEKAEGTR